VDARGKKPGAALPESFGEIPVRYREEEATVPGTDRQEYRDLVYGTKAMTSCCSFDAALTISKTNWRSLKTKRKYGTTDPLCGKAADASFQSFGRPSTLVDARIETVFGSMKALVKSNSPVFLDFVVGNNRWHSVGRCGNFDPGDYCRGVAATCEVSAFLIDRRIKVRSQEKQSSITYLHYAKKEGLL
jgi:hypothetical protein